MEANTTQGNDSPRKFHLSDDPADTLVYDAKHLLRRIVCDTPFTNKKFGLLVQAGDKGGYIEKENNLSQKGACWIGGNAKVMDDCFVSNDAYVYGDACLRGRVCLYGTDSCIGDNAMVTGSIDISNYVSITDSARLCLKDDVFSILSYTTLCDEAIIRGSIAVHGSLVMKHDSSIDGPRVCVRGTVRMFGNSAIRQTVTNDGPVTLFLDHDCELCHDMTITSSNDYATIRNFWSSGHLITYLFNDDLWKTGCFTGNSLELIAKAFADDFFKGLCFKATVKWFRRINRIKKWQARTRGWRLRWITFLNIFICMWTYVRARYIKH